MMGSNLTELTRPTIFIVSIQTMDTEVVVV